MLKRVVYILIALFLIVMTIIIRFFLSNTPFPEKSRDLYIYTGKSGKDEVMKQLEEKWIIEHNKSFSFLANQMNVWSNIKPGKYTIKKGTSLFELAKILRGGQQTPVNLVINKLRTKENLAALISKKFEIDSLAFINYINNNDSLKQYGLDTNTVMTAVFPNTYTYLWTTKPDGIFKKLFAEYKKVWNDTRLSRADSLSLSPAKAYILASIIEEETTFNPEKGLMASVYLNRLNKNMPLGADPTIKFALRDFGLKRIYVKHLAVESPYNTYRYQGLPPGPICTPSIVTLDSVLKAPKTNYLFFVAKKDFSQGHVFTTSYQEHLKYAREYQKALNHRAQQKQKKASDEIANE